MLDKLSMTCSEFVLALSNIKRWGKGKIANYVIKHGYDLEECLNFLELELNPDEFFAFHEGLRNAKIDLEKNKEQGISFISLFDDAFPKELCECKSPVAFLYFKGNINLLKANNKLAVIGKRENPPESILPMSFVALGYQAVHYLVEKYDAVIVSGLATGCDTIAHRATLDKNGKTIAVLPSSPAHITPAENSKLADEILNKEGLLVSEYSVLDEIRLSNFVERDRIQSLLTKAVLVICSEKDGGAMHAVRRSLDDGKPVFALIGNKLNEIDNYIDSNDEKQLDFVFNSMCK